LVLQKKWIFTKKWGVRRVLDVLEVVFFSLKIQDTHVTTIMMMMMAERKEEKTKQ